MRVAFRTEASGAIGTGHLARCLTLADRLHEQGDESCFLVSGEEPLVAAALAGRAHRLHFLGQRGDWRIDADAEATLAVIGDSVDWLVVDHYGLDSRWESLLAPRVGRLLVLDDLADRPHDCDLLVDPGVVRDAADYRGLLSARCELLLGPRYALLRPAFAAQRGQAVGEAAGDRLHLFFGGGDASPRWLGLYCGRLLEAFGHVEIEAVGQADRAVMQELQARYGQRLTWQPQVDNMAQHMARCSVAMGGPGSATWERACVGLPMALVATADNQVAILRQLESAGFVRYLGRVEEVSSDGFGAAVGSFLADRAQRRVLRERGVAAVDGNGAAHVARRMRGSRGSS